ncbi:hypothetical protein D5F11_016710 [Siminovitchia terrae]|uniref:Uncharacterized protein n=1 Tax=Siminovitchia terrae TaxID=1914933 RepID=A0A429X5F5_SIMTE|nr:hypothetical protein [Siminovitchia terrae]RST58668.1 hypothetical protein D5F11_016710 [Siminovitchia terrae]
MNCWKPLYIIISFLFYFYISIPTQISAEEIGDKTERQAFSDFEEKIFNLIRSSMEPLRELENIYGKTDKVNLYNIALSAEERFNKSSLIITELEVPIVLSSDIRASLENIKRDLSVGFKALGESMDYFSQHNVNRSSELYDIYIENVIKVSFMLMEE